MAIARALAGSPRLLLADEPTGNLDTQMARGVMDLLEELHRDGATIVMVTHDPELAVRAQREVHIVDGQVVDLAPQPRLVAARASAVEHSWGHAMFNYYLQLALRSLKRNVVLTVLMVAAIGVGIGASMTTLTVFRAMDARSDPAQVADSCSPCRSTTGARPSTCVDRRYGQARGPDQLHRRHRR